MSEIAIYVRDLGKQYHVGAIERSGRYKSLRESVTKSISAPFRHVRTFITEGRNHENARETMIWALKDVSCDMEPVRARCSKFWVGAPSLLRAVRKFMDAQDRCSR